jgi:hypothetical protein
MVQSLIVAIALVSATPLSGKVDTGGLGTLSLPPGEWMLEHRHLSPDQEKRPDCCVFKKLRPRLERITILRYRSHIAPRKPVYLCDSVADSYLIGIPDFIAKNRPDFIPMHRRKESYVFTLRKPRDWYAQRIEISYVYTSKDEEPWMSHAILMTQSRAAFVCVHSSPHVLSPETIDDLVTWSTFLPKAGAVRNDAAKTPSVK